MNKIRLMIEENDVGDDTIGLFHVDFLKDAFTLSFIMKVMHIFIEHFIISTGNSPKTLFESFAKAYTKVMNIIEELRKHGFIDDYAMPISYQKWNNEKYREFLEIINKKEDFNE